MYMITEQHTAAAAAVAASESRPARSAAPWAAAAVCCSMVIYIYIKLYHIIVPSHLGSSHLGITRAVLFAD